MAKFRVVYKQIQPLYLDVEANSPEEAREIAENTDGGEFVEYGMGNWEYCHTVVDKNGEIIYQ